MRITFIGLDGWGQKVLVILCLCLVNLIIERPVWSRYHHITISSLFNALLSWPQNLFISYTDTNVFQPINFGFSSSKQALRSYIFFVKHNLNCLKIFYWTHHTDFLYLSTSSQFFWYISPYGTLWVHDDIDSGDIRLQYQQYLHCIVLPKLHSMIKSSGFLAGLEPLEIRV